VSLLGVELLQVVSLVLSDDGQNTGNGLADNLDLAELRGRSTGDLGDSQLGEFLSQVKELLLKISLGLLAKRFGGQLRHIE